MSRFYSSLVTTFTVASETSFAVGILDDLKKAIEDPEHLHLLLKEYNII